MHLGQPASASGQFIPAPTSNTMDIVDVLLNFYHVLALYLVAKYVSIFIFNLLVAVYAHFIVNLIWKPVDLTSKYGKWAGEKIS